MKKIENSDSAFNNLKNLRYINLYGVQNLNIEYMSGLINKTLIVCQDNDYLIYNNSKSICCDFNLELEKCYSNNYIKVTYIQNNGYTPYFQGFKKASNPKGSGYVDSPARDGINFILMGDSIYTKDEPLKIDQDNIIELHFHNDITTLEKLFYDDYCKRIDSIDLSHFDSSLVTNTANMFYECTSIKELSLTNFNTSSVTNMESMFYKCNSLRTLDLSNFDTSKVTNMANMFRESSGLYYLDISNFNFTNIIEASNMFDSATRNLIYLNAYNAKNYYSYFIFSAYYNFVINQKENIFYNEKSHYNFILTNCDTNKNPLDCNSTNYITITYKSSVKYSYGFSNNINNRRTISYIINQDKIVGHNHY